MSNGKNFFDQEEDFRDVPDEVSGKSAVEILQEQPAAPAPRRAPLKKQAVQEAAPVEEDYDVTEELEDEEDDYSEVLSDAMLRLEQGQLYKMIMNHDLFEGVDSSPAAVKNVQRQIRKFAKEQMEIMLGMRRETAKIERLEIDFPFNQVEVKVLKMVAEKASGGASKESDRFVPEVTKTIEEVPVVGKRQGLNSITLKKAAPVKPKAPAAPQKQAAQAPKALKKSAATPVARAKKSNTPDQVVVNGEVITKAQIDATFEPDYKPLEKQIHEMTSEELLERNKETAKRRHKTVKNPNALPMPTYEQEAMLHQSRILENSQGSNAVALIMNAINNTAKK